MSKRKFKNFFISPAFQLTLILTTLILMSITFIIIYLQIDKSFDLMFEIGRRMKLAETSAYYRLLSNQLGIIKNNFFIAISICYLVSTIFMIVVSHKLAGPVYRLKMFFKSIIESDSKAKLSFRQLDFNQDLPPIVNQALDKIRSEK